MDLFIVERAFSSPDMEHPGQTLSTTDCKLFLNVADAQKFYDQTKGKMNAVSSRVVKISGLTGSEIAKS